MIVLMGNKAAKEPYREEVDYSHWTDAEIEAKAADVGVAVEVNGEKRSREALVQILSDRLSHRLKEGNRVTKVVVPEGTSLAEVFTTITARDGVWANHSFDPAPAWIETKWEALGVLLADHYKCPTAKPEGEEWIG